MNGKENILWAPQAGPQKALIDCPLPEIFFGGARGGGKSDGVLGKWALKAQRYGRHFNAILFRKTMPSQDDMLERSRDIYGPMGAKLNATTSSWRFPNGARIRFRPLERVSDAEKYQGQNLTDVGIEEAGVFPDPKPIDRLHGVLRSAAGVPTQLLLTGNPGGPGQLWIKRRYIDPAPHGMEVLRRELPNGALHEYVFIPSRIQDNRALLESDPTYINRLYLVGSEELVRAWLEGDWSVIEGAFFDCWNPRRHVVRPTVLPEHWLRFRSADWGFAAPFSFGWWAVASEAFEHPDGPVIPKGAMLRYREWYGADEPNVGLRIPAEDVGAELVERERDDPKDSIKYGVLDPSAFASDGGPSIGERLWTGSGKKINWRKADNRRVPQRGAMGGWDQMRGRLIGDDIDGQGKVPMIYFFSTCTDSIRTIPALQHDEDRAEDLDTDAEDHAADEVRYGCMSRPWTRPMPGTPKPKFDYETTTGDGSVIVGNVPIRELIDRQMKRMEER